MLNKLVVVLGLLVLSTPVWAAPQRQVATLSTPGTERSLMLPAAVDRSPVIALGEAVDPGTGQAVEGYAFVHYRDEGARGGNPAKPPKGGEVCYSFLASGAKWKTVEPWVVNPSNGEGLDESFVASNLAADIAKWESAAEGVDILGSGSQTGEVLAADTVAPDEVNEVYFGDIDSPGAIAVTIVRGVFRGRPSERKLVEWDQVNDQVAYNWSGAGEAGKMDFENIPTHELGHAAGMGHPSASRAEETMYRFADFGEIKKQTLEQGDIAGVKALY